MPRTVPAPFEALFAGPSDTERAAVELLCRLVDGDSEVAVEVDGRRVTLPDSLRLLLRDGLREARRGDAIRHALRGASARTLVQPIADLRTGDVAGFEALTDLGARSGGAQWIHDAAAVGVREQLELLLVEMALGHLDRLPSGVYLSVNVSPSTARATGLEALLADVDAKRVVLEITEHAPVDDYAALERALHPLRARGVRVAVDDAGAGFASLTHVLRIRPDIVKVDASLVSDVAADARSRALVGGLARVATELGAQCVAEGVERADQVGCLRDLGVGFGQGWHLGPPRNAAAGTRVRARRPGRR